MKYVISQWVTIVDMNDEIMAKTLFQHGEYESLPLTVGCTVITWQLGLREFEVVYDQREGKQTRFKVTDIELDLLSQPAAARIYLEPVQLILGHHDIGQAG